MSSIFRLAVSLLVVLALLTTQTALANSRPPRNNDISNMADALKYLQDLDIYYGDRARARFGKRAPLIQLLHQHLLDYPEMARALDHLPTEEPF